MCRDIRWVGVWRSGQQVTVALISITDRARLSGRHQTVFEHFLGSESCLTAVQTTVGHGVEVWRDDTVLLHSCEAAFWT